MKGFGWGEVGGDGGYDGGDAPKYNGFNGGKGQGTTTRYFGESAGTLYAGGGGGGTGGGDSGSGGAGGGGNGGSQYGWSGPGSPNTGGGAGGAGSSDKYGSTSYSYTTMGSSGGYTATKLGASVTPGQKLSIVVGSGGNEYSDEYLQSIGANHKISSGGSGICIIRWDDQKS